MATFDDRFSAAFQPRTAIPPEIAAQSPPPSPPPTPALLGSPAPAAPDADARIASDLAKADEQIRRAELSMRQEEQIGARRAQGQGPIIDRMRAANAQPLPTPPKPQQTPPAPQRQSSKDDENWVMACALLGALAGAFTRRHQSNALAAFTGAMEGYQQGSAKKFDQNMKIWEAENKRAIEANQQAQQEYKDILENRKLSIDQMSVELELVSKKYQDQAMETAAKTKNSIVIAQLYDQRAKAEEQMKIYGERISNANEQFQQRQQQQLAIAQMRALGAVNPQQQSALIDAIGTYKLAPITGIRGSAVMAQVAEKYPDYSENEYRKRRAQEIAEGGTTARAASNMDLVMRSAGPVIELAAKAAMDVPRTGFPRLNSIFVENAARELGDPKQRTFALANLELSRVIARAMNPRSSTITNQQAREAQEMLSTADSPEAYQAVLQYAKSFIEREFWVTQQALKMETMPEIQLPDTTQRKLQPTPRQFLPPATGGATTQRSPTPSLTGQPPTPPIDYRTLEDLFR